MEHEKSGPRAVIFCTRPDHQMTLALCDACAAEQLAELIQKVEDLERRLREAES